MMTAESMVSNRPVLRITVVLFSLFKLFSSHNFRIPKNQFYFAHIHKIAFPNVKDLLYL